MKKSLIAVTLLAATSAFAGITATTSYDYDNVNSSKNKLTAQHEGTLGLAYGTKFGTVDAAVTGRRLDTANNDYNLGFEVGYTNGIKLGAVNLKGRAAYGRFNQVETKTAGFSGNSSYYSLAAEASTPITKQVTAFGGVRMRNGINAETPGISTRYTAGVDVAVVKGLTARVGYAFTKQEGLNLNGITTAVSYAF